MSDFTSKGCFCFGRSKADFPKTFKETNKILKKYKDNHLEISDELILEVMIRLYVSENKKKPIEMLQRCRLNPNYQISYLRQDLEYFIPQLINFMVFHQQLSDEQLIQFVQRASAADFFFAHLVYFQLKSLSQIVTPSDTITFNVVKRFLDIFLQDMTCNYAGNLLIANNILEVKFYEQPSVSSISLNTIKNRTSTLQEVYKGSLKVKQYKENETIQTYGTRKWSQYIQGKQLDQLISNSKEIELQDYVSIFAEDTPKSDTAFLSNIKFWSDIMRICDEMSFIQKKSAKVEFLHQALQKINENLPGSVYVPFVKDSIRNYALLKIIAKESKVFSTKMRSPFSLTLEIFRPEAEGNKSVFQIDKEISAPIKATMTRVDQLTQSQLIQEGQILNDDRRTFSQEDSYKIFLNDFQQMKYFQNNRLSPSKPHQQGISQCYRGLENSDEEFDSENKRSFEDLSQPDQIGNIPAFSIEEKSEKSELKVERSVSSQSNSWNGGVSFLQSNKGIILNDEEIKDIKQIIFGESSQLQSKRIKEQSIFKNLESWKLVHLIIKTGDNLKQEQFALQLICQFDQIFKKEGLPLKLHYYEVLSMGPDCGIIEMIKNATTIDSLQRNLQTKLTQFKNFSDFFRSYFRNNIEIALQNYVQSLAAYSLVCYFMQVKDRHNGNILLDSNGHLIHIDFGFFLSISPGKGVEFEKKVPFKLLSDYIEVLGGAKGHLFQEHFRKLFFKGFKACQKHQKEILLLVEMMYTGHGTTLPCFQKGEQALKDLEHRFNPRVGSDAELFVFVQELINKSLDNWRARWYDKFQYFAQGVFY